ncbi:hypothetical protein CAOG_09144 [Capsaspora owczarzaki ATCC 30864]|uniref:SUZ domain-containing protein n=1 Tax=Capsaspora owczarzaki (strain ATCC 30864) TaxID=595528 RepID=A0A0D2WXI0_CAPO3|nr:hypothetical protein CAOG_09144 [Capsaspora owczarzaki ATCC 30864]KJE97910.1 hypothetical protein CAOG_009144 [Capsaspora owczarzaki ATCC 30864]|eukprot:XP_011270857.1 hypothetical protein CAOG_09144 [Capsaspora owczarzaki ATCC 30864]
MADLDDWESAADAGVFDAPPPAQTSDRATGVPESAWHQDRHEAADDARRAAAHEEQRHERDLRSFQDSQNVAKLAPEVASTLLPYMPAVRIIRKPATVVASEQQRAQAARAASEQSRAASMLMPSERDAAYAAARERILGAAPETRPAVQATPVTLRPREPVAPPQSQLQALPQATRQPRGPSSGSATGFTRRQDESR